MTESNLDKYVLNGGWSMCLLLPFSVVALAVSMRCILALRGRLVRKLAEDLRGRLAAGSHAKSPTAEDARAESYAVALGLYALLQPLWTLFVLSPLVGLTGSITTLINAFGRSSPGTAVLPALQHALIPPLWGVSVAAVSYAVAAICRARIYAAESEVLLPAATAEIEAQQPGRMK